MDGLSAIQLIRKEESAGILRRSHVIALTGNARQQQIEDALAAGMDSGEPRDVARSQKPRPLMIPAWTRSYGTNQRESRSCKGRGAVACRAYVRLDYSSIRVGITRQVVGYGRSSSHGKGVRSCICFP
jgi:CheY-like chemotaxis protein